MDVLLVRHATAFAIGERPGLDSDSERDLSPIGIEKMKLASLGLKHLIDDLDVILCSPLIRTVQTSEILSRTFSNTPIEPLDSLSPDRVNTQRLCEAIEASARAGHQRVAYVGHEPSLGIMFSELLGGSGCYFFGFKKSAMALLEFGGSVGVGEASLSWCVKPAQLRLLGRVKPTKG